MNGRPAIRIVIAEPCALLRSGMKRLLDDELDFDVVGEAVDTVEIVERVRQLRPDILLLDIGLCNFDRLSALRMLGVLNIEVKIILLGRELDEQQLQLALQFGARGAIGKGSSPELLIKSIRAVASGEYWFDRATLATASRTRTASVHDVTPTLTPREMEIVAEIVAGSSNAQIGARLHISEETVKRHLANVYAKLGVSNRLQLALLAVGNSAAKAAVA